MDIRQTCCSADKRELVFPSFSVVFIHTFMLSDGVISQEVGKVSDVDLDDAFKKMRRALRDDPKVGDIPVSSLAEYVDKEGVYIVKMRNEVEELLFPPRSFSNNQIARYSMRGFDFRIPVRAAKEEDSQGIEVADFPSVDFQGHANVEVSQFFGNIFSVTYRFLFDGFTCKILKADESNHFAMGDPDTKTVKATTNQIIGLLSCALGAEYWSDDDDDDDNDNDNDRSAGIDLINRLIVDKFWLNSDGDVAKREEGGRLINSGTLEKKQKDKSFEECEGGKEDDSGVWVIKDKDSVFDWIVLRYKKYISKIFQSGVSVEEMSVKDDSRYAMVDIWETVKHPYSTRTGTYGTRDLFSDNRGKKLSEADIVNHIRDYHKPELVGLMSMYPAEWPYRAAEAYDDVCGENIAIDTDDLVLAGSHMTVVIGTYGRRGDGVNGVNWKQMMRDRRLYHVSWEEYLLIIQFILAKKYTFNNATDRLLKLTDDMSLVTKRMIGNYSKEALAASKKAIALDVIKQMKFPSHKIMYDRAAKRLELDNDFQRFKDIQDVVSGNLQSLGECHVAEADSRMNFLLMAISVVSLLELLYQESKWPLGQVIFGCELKWWATVTSVISGFLAVISLGVLISKIDWVETAKKIEKWFKETVNVIKTRKNG